MRHIEILLPFGLPPPLMAADLLPNLRTPALATLLAKAARPTTRVHDPFARHLPHEAWLAQRLGLAHGLAAQSPVDSAPAMTIHRMHSAGLPAEDGTWFVANPVHIHIARDHLVLTDRRRLPLADAESRALFEAALPIFEAAGKTLRYGAADVWFVRADDWHALRTTTPDAACGHNIDIWMPKGDGERAWRKLQNEVQMEWHAHAVNAAREERREPPVNSLWLWGAAQGSGQAAFPPVFDAGADPAALLTAATGDALIVLDTLSEPALAEEWGGWLERLHQLEATWFAPLLQALQGGSITSLTLIAGHNAALREFTLGQRSLMKFWAPPSLTRLLP